MASKKPKLFVLIMWTMYVIVSALCIDDSLKYVEWMALISIIVFFVTNTHKLVSAYTWIMLIAYVYQFGQLWLLLLGVSMPQSSYLITNFEVEHIISASWFFLILITLIHLFGTIFSREEDYDLKKIHAVPDEAVLYRKAKALEATGILFLFFCALVLTYNDVRQILAAEINGYVGAYHIGTDNGLIYMCMKIFPLCIAAMMCSEKKIIVNIAFCYSMVRSLVLMLLVGNRGQYIAMIMLCLLLKLLGNHKIKTKQLVKLGILGILLVFLSSFVANTRDIVESDSATLIKAIVDNNIMFQFLQELGGTMVDLIMVVDLSPDILDWGYGISYIGSFIVLIPKMSSLFPELTIYNSIGSVLNPFFSKGSGLGGSFCAEIYLNFGWLSILFTPLMGKLLSVMSYNIRKNRNSPVTKRVFNAYMFFVTLMYIRGGILDFAVYLRYGFYFMLVYFLVKEYYRYCYKVNIMSGQKKISNENNFLKL